MGIAFDKEGRTFRKGIAPDFKVNRPPTPDDLVPQFELIRQIVRALNVPVVEFAGNEADERTTGRGWSS